jgi:hypothetical protein
MVGLPVVLRVQQFEKPCSREMLNPVRVKADQNCQRTVHQMNLSEQVMKGENRDSGSSLPVKNRFGNQVDTNKVHFNKTRSWKAGGVRNVGRKIFNNTAVKKTET